MQARKRSYNYAARDIETAVQAGKTTKEDAEKRMIEMRKAMFGQDGKDRDK